jgi:enediyne biosynthesis protein E4
LKASPKEPVWLFHGDFDGNGQEDPLIFHYMEGHLVPFASRDDLIKQIAILKSKHDTYVSYSGIRSPEDLLDRDQLAMAKRQKAENFQSGLIRENKGQFEFIPFPIEAQFGPVRDFVSFESQGQLYVLAIGGFKGFRNDLGKAIAQPLLMLRWESDRFIPVPVGIKGSEYWGELRSAEKIKIKGEDYILMVRNNDAPVFLAITNE